MHPRGGRGFNQGIVFLLISQIMLTYRKAVKLTRQKNLKWGNKCLKA